MNNIDKYKDAYLREARQYLDTFNSSLIKLEKTPGNLTLLGPMLHACHTYKSMSGIAHHLKTSTLCHAIEDVLVRIKKKGLKVGACADLLFQCFNALETSLKAVANGKEEIDTDDLVKDLRKIAAKKSPEQSQEATVEGIEESKEEIFADLTVTKIQSIEVKVERLDLLMRLSEELLINKLGLERIKETLQNPELSSSVDTLTRLVSDLQFNIMQSRTVPLNFVFNRFPRMVRDMAKQQKKEVNLELVGGDIELDRSIVDALAEPLVHLVRNTIDHGIETPKQREGLKKPSQATLTLSAKRTRGFAIIEIFDDGKGIDWDEIKRQSQRLKLISAHSVQEELVNALFSGMSTTKEVTEISGRGFGLNIVKQRIESLGGSVKAESQLLKGTKFILEIPLNLAVFKVLFVKVGPKPYAIPLTNVEKLIHVKKEDIKGMLDYDAIVFEGEDIPITRLNELFSLPRLDQNLQPIVIVKKEEDRLGMAVDELGQTQEIVLKPLRLAKEGKYFTGCTILGSGEVALILDVANLILSKRKLLPCNINF
ncbi:MAG: chemotaxis protein CheA [Candidatus Omnitrophota bacterium]|nr:chemotaxis protein CheA [Candidatus Omnitrophota bacterium]